jgi:hypothetical protein
MYYVDPYYRGPYIGPSYGYIPAASITMGDRISGEYYGTPNFGAATFLVAVARCVSVRCGSDGVKHAVKAGRSCRQSHACKQGA